MDNLTAPERDDRRFLRFGDVIVDLERNIVLCNGDVSRIEPRASEVLRYLVAANGRVVSRDELMREVWRVHVVDEAIQRVIAMLRQALGSPGPDSAVIETVPRKGYRLIADVTDVELAGYSSQPERSRSWPELAAAFVAGMLLAAMLLWLVDTGDAIAPQAPPAATASEPREAAAAPPAPAPSAP